MSSKTKTTATKEDATPARVPGGETQPRLRFPEFQNAGEWESAPIRNFAVINPRREVRPDNIEVSFVPMSAVSVDGFLTIPETRP